VKQGIDAMNILRLAFVAMALLMSLVTGVNAQTTLRIGLAEDPDILDPTLARTYVGRIVFAAFCDKLFDIDEKLNIVPQLALSHETSADGKEVTIKLRPASNSTTASHSTPRPRNFRSSAT
jgi:peptide/nickel transport system substrate-binding protein